MNTRMRLTRVRAGVCAAVVVVATGLVACGSESESTDDAAPASISTPSTPLPPTSPNDTPASTALPEPAQPPEPQRVEFQADDGLDLVGYYYPAAFANAPVVVLMHWAGGTHCDWVGVDLVQWAQNRGLPDGTEANPACENVDTHVPAPSEEFPPLPADQSYAVFAFDYRGFGESGGSDAWDPAGYLMDSFAGVETARGMQGVDPTRIATIGASIGADGAIDACAEGCLGAFSLSPGNYLEVDYAGAVTVLAQEDKPAWCVASVPDREAYPVCDNASGDRFRKSIYEDMGHGMSYFEVGLDPQVTQTLDDFVRLVFGVETS